MLGFGGEVSILCGANALGGMAPALDVSFTRTRGPPVCLERAADVIVGARVCIARVVGVGTYAHGFERSIASGAVGPALAFC